jgi:hypothetical protein
MIRTNIADFSNASADFFPPWFIDGFLNRSPRID